MTGADLARQVTEDWTVAALLAHLAFWDRFVLARWEAALGEGVLPMVLPSGAIDMINAAAQLQWSALPIRSAGPEAMRAAEAVDRRIEELPSEMVDRVRAHGLERMLDRSRHRTQHLDEIERALAG